MSGPREHILARLSCSDSPISGDVLAEELKLSRASIWKHIDILRKQGMQISALAGQGYQLQGEVLNATTLAAQLPNTKTLGKYIQHFDSIDSTNREAMRQAEKDCSEGLVILANQQDTGRGRLGRTWHTLHDSLALSVVLRPNLPPEQVPQLSLVAAVAVQQALSKYCADIRIKWPNDLLIHGAKVAGILTEMRGEPGLVHAVIVGIGININTPKNGWPDDITQRVTSLSEHTLQAVSRLQCAAAIIASLDEHYHRYLEQGFAPIGEAWWQAHAASKQKVRVHDGRNYIEGIATGLDSDGALLLSNQHGTQRIIAGELELLDI